MKLNTVKRAASVALTAALLVAAGQGVAVASDPQWESTPLSAPLSDPQWETAPLTATLP